MRRISRRQLVGGAAPGGVALASGVDPAGLLAPDADARRRKRLPPIGRGGAPMDLDAIAALASRAGRGQPLAFCDLAAVDQNSAVIEGWAARNGMAVRPALKAFQSPGLSAYVLRRLPEPRGMVFHLNQVDEIVARTPPGTDLLMGYPPTVGQLKRFLRRRGPRRRHRLRLLIDSVPLAEQLVELSKDSRRPLPLDVALEFDSGMGRGGVDSADELSALIGVLRRGRKRLRLGAVLCYDGHATLDGAQPYRALVAESAQGRFRGFLDQLAEEGGDLYDPRRLVRNGPASSNYRNWAGSEVANEISPGSAFVRAGYLDSFDNAGLAPAITQASPVMRVTGDNPSVPLTQTTLPGSSREEIIIEAGPWAGSQIVRPGGVSEDALSGGGFALTAPKGSVQLGDYLLMRPEQSGDGIDPFGSLVAVREGRVLRRWRTQSRWSTD